MADYESSTSSSPKGSSSKNLSKSSGSSGGNANTLRTVSANEDGMSVREHDSTDMKSALEDEKIQQDKKRKNQSFLQKTIKTQAITHGLFVAFQFIRLTVVAVIMQAIVNFVLAVVKTIVSAVTTAAAAVASAITGAVSSIASFLSVSTTAAAVVAISSTVVAATLVTAPLVDMATRGGRTDGQLMVQSGCSVDADDAVNGDGSDEQTSQKFEENAKKVFQAFSGANYDKIHIAGMLGNFKNEGGLDPTCVESIYDEPYKIGTRKKEAEKKGFKVHDYNYSYWSRIYHNPGMRGGIGISQESNEGNDEMVAFAKKNKKDWYDLDLQLAFIMKQGKTEKYRKTHFNTASAAAEWFCRYWEIPNMAYAHLESRKSDATKYLAKLETWDTDDAYADSIVAMSKISVDDAADNAVSSALATCTHESGYDNSTIADAAVSLCQEDISMAAHDGSAATSTVGCTDHYVEVHNKVLPGDSYYRSCDRFVATSVRYSGYDDNFCPGNVPKIYSYLVSSDKWTQVSKSEIKPGDVCITGGKAHIFLYVGEEAFKKRFPDSSYTHDAASASYSDYAPCCQNWAGWNQSNTMYVFRNCNKDRSSKYTDADDKNNDEDEKQKNEGKQDGSKDNKKD